ncbi:MAG: transposase family protein, partial [Traorella sp.]
MKKCNKIKGEFLFVDEFIKQLDINDECITVDSITKFIHIFSEIEESSIKGKCTYRIEDLLIITLMAKLARLGDNSCQIAAYAKANKVKLTMLGLIKDNKIPSHDTFRRLFMMIEPESLRNIFIAKLEDYFERIYKFVEGKNNYKHLGVDGKEFRG